MLATTPAPTEPATPTRREFLAALGLALLLALAFVGRAVRTDTALMPFVPERYEPLASEARAEGSLAPDALTAGNVTMGDKYNQSLAWDRIQQDALQGGRIRRWTDRIAGGAAFVPQMAQVYQPWNLLLLLPIDSAGIYGLWYVLHLVLWGLGAWWFLRRVGLAQASAVFGMVLAVLGLWTQARVHHNVILSAALPLWPLWTIVHAAFVDARAGRRAVGPARAAVIALLVGITWSGGFAPVSLQVSLSTAALAAGLAITTRRFRPLLPLAAAAALGGVIALAQMGPTLVAAAHSSRGTATPEQLSAAGLAWGHLSGLVFPDLLHWPDRPRQYPTFAAFVLTPDRTSLAVNANGNWPETAFAIGLPGALALVAGLVARRRMAIVAGLVAALAFGLATARTPFLELSGLIPGARAGDLRRFLFLASVAATVAAATGADALLRAPLRPRRTLAGVALAIAACSAVLLHRWGLPTADPAAFTADWSARLHDAVGGVVEGMAVTVEMIRAQMERDPVQSAAQHAHLAATFARTTALALLAAAALWLPSGRRAVLALAALAAVELLVVGHGTIVPVPVERVNRVPALVAPVLAATRAAEPGAPVRMTRLEAPGAGDEPRLLPPNLGAYHGVHDLGAYNPLPPRRMEELFLAIEPDAPGKPSAALRGAGVRGFHRATSLHHPLLDLLAARFVLTGRPLTAAEAGDALVDVTPPDTPPPCRLYERRTALPRATFVDTVEVVADPAERLARLADVARDPSRVTILEGGRPLTGDGVTDADVAVVHDEPEHVIVEVTAREPGVLRLADPWAPGWTATVDGVPHPLWIADHYVRAVRLPPGRHRVEFRFDGLAARGFERLAGIGLLATLGLLAIGVFQHCRRSGRSARSGEASV